jgi:hypothetical protein
MVCGDGEWWAGSTGVFVAATIRGASREVVVVVAMLVSRRKLVVFVVISGRIRPR